MTVATAVFLGILQALGEFLPISSSAHLALFPFFSGEVYQGLTYDVALHLATLIAVVAYFCRDILTLTKAGLFAPKTQDGKLFWFIGLATVPAALAGYFFEDAAENIFRSPLMIAVMLIVFAAFLMFAGRVSAKLKEKRTELTLGIMLLIGLAQALAIMPGVSRSGITITAALLLGLNHTQSARISFLLSIPIIAGAAVLKLKDIALSDINAAFIAGFFAALICGWLVIKFLMKYIQSHSFDIFAYYRFALGAVIIALYFARM
ncbi:MAG: undecaprenyl-diphosphate phosphatase [Elusimicrobiota bacterium]|jgi:undecaprenyl-diphosphatase|nr:undecaprenyl-diphosphate phosphatase [Elusimicrobiota bacterium]